MSGDSVRLERAGGIATIRFDRPDSLNAVSTDLQRDLRDALKDLVDDPADGIVVTGVGDVTCAGMDTELVSDPDYHEKYADEIDRLNDEIEALFLEYPRPTIMAAQGALVGVGFVYSLHCDLLVMGEETHFSLPEVSYGISTADVVPDIVAQVGERAALEIAVHGQPIDPHRAHDLGLVNDVVPDDEVQDRAREMLEEIAEYDENVVEDILGAV